jgi:hypothetical protein
MSKTEILTSVYSACSVGNFGLGSHQAGNHSNFSLGFSQTCTTSTTRFIPMMRAA